MFSQGCQRHSVILIRLIFFGLNKKCFFVSPTSNPPSPKKQSSPGSTRVGFFLHLLRFASRTPKNMLREAAAALLEGVTDRPKVTSEGWHPLPSRAARSSEERGNPRESEGIRGRITEWVFQPGARLFWGVPLVLGLFPSFFGGRGALQKWTAEKSWYPYSNLSTGGPRLGVDPTTSVGNPVGDPGLTPNQVHPRETLEIDGG